MLNYVVGRAVRSPSGWSGASSARARVAAGGRPIGRKASSSTSSTTPPAAGAAPSDGGGGSRGRGAYKAFFFAGTGFAAGAAFAHLRPEKAS
ncbi:unnamed protein product [Ectocarpus sp. 6 AP-2014]